LIVFIKKGTTAILLAYNSTDNRLSLCPSNIEKQRVLDLVSIERLFWVVFAAYQKILGVCCWPIAEAREEFLSVSSGES
jgi:hypothetical protein